MQTDKRVNIQTCKHTNMPAETHVNIQTCKHTHDANNQTCNHSNCKRKKWQGCQGNRLLQCKYINVFRVFGVNCSGEFLTGHTESAKEAVNLITFSPKYTTAKPTYVHAGLNNYDFHNFLLRYKFYENCDFSHFS